MVMVLRLPPSPESSKTMISNSYKRLVAIIHAIGRASNREEYEQLIAERNELGKQLFKPNYSDEKNARNGNHAAD